MLSQHPGVDAEHTWTSDSAQAVASSKSRRLTFLPGSSQMPSMSEHYGASPISGEMEGRRPSTGPFFIPHHARSVQNNQEHGHE
jgi:hypothetical protein